MAQKWLPLIPIYRNNGDVSFGGDLGDLRHTPNRFMYNEAFSSQVQYDVVESYDERQFRRQSVQIASNLDCNWSLFLIKNIGENLTYKFTFSSNDEAMMFRMLF